MKRLNRTIRTLGLAGAALMLLDCGYALVGRSSSLPEDIESIYVQNLENRTARAQIDQILTQAITTEFITRRRYQVVNSAGEADAVLSGMVMGFRVRPVTFARLGDQVGRATEYEVLISARMSFVRTDTQEVIWERPVYQFRESYEIEISASGYFDRENIALDQVSKQFAETLVIDVLEGF